MKSTPKKSFLTPARTPQSGSTKSCSPIDQDYYGGRFIPNRVSSNLKHVFEKADQFDVRGFQPDENSVFNNLLADQLFGQEITNQLTKSTSLLRYRPQQTNQIYNKENTPLAPQFESSMMSQSANRKITKTPFKILDAPQLQDDFYLNLVDWSAQDHLAVGLQNAVYLWSAASQSVSHLCDLNNDNVASVAWSFTGNHISVGTSTGKVLIYDATTKQQIRKFAGHNARVSALSWNNYLLSSGSRDRSILHRDLRAPDTYLARLIGHRQEVCGLKWSFDGQQLASGGNDNKLILWNMNSASPVAKYSEHTAAVKAIAWSPHQYGLLASGGGTADRTIRFWNTFANECVQRVETDSQVCNLMFSKHSQEIISTHGYSQNQVVVWKYPKMQKLAVLLGHTSRVLYLAMSADGQTVVTGAGDETLRFWNVFPSQETTDDGANSEMWRAIR